MAHQSWSFDCMEGCTLPSPRCTTCGRTGRYAGWSRGVVEMWGQFNRFYRLNPLGPEAGLAQEILGPVTGRCRECDGTGLVADLSEWGLTLCPACDGTGRIRQCSAEEFERLRQVVLARAAVIKQEEAARADGRDI